MKKHVTIALALFSFISLVCYGQEKPQLTSSQKVKDFEFLYETLKDNYPYFGVGKRTNGIDWLSKKEEYINLVQKTESDSAYIFTLKSILSELKCGHVHLGVTQWANEGYREAYRLIVEESPNSDKDKWLAMFDISPDRTEYWAKILNKKEVSQSATSKTKIKPVKKNNYSDTIISNGQDRIAIMTIQSFSHLRIKKDKPEIENFLSNIKGCNTLIINIHDNGGGSEEYWQNNIVARLIQTPINYLMYPIIKDGEMNRRFYPQYFEKERILQKGDALQRIPQELLNEKYYIKEEQDTITPNNPVDFQGKIYLLVSEKVFSTSEHFAQFCKTTGWATIAGERTGGDGIGSDPIIVRLPESGILLCYPALIGVNHDGALNFEERTNPDILIDGKNADERLSNLINYIRSKE